LYQKKRQGGLWKKKEQILNGGHRLNHHAAIAQVFFIAMAA